MDNIAIGIDLGTTNSCIGYYNPESDQIEIIPNLNGDRITPSLFSISDGEILIGKDALNNHDQIISHVKRFIGQREHQCQESLSLLEYQIDIDHEGYPLIPINGRKYRAEEISAQILSYLKKSAESYLDQPITKAVVTVPAYFNQSQRRATKDACTIAGIECLRLVAEPTAAALCYGLDKCDHSQTVLVVDIGGGTSDFSILRLNDGIFEVVATSGNSHLGGLDIDHALIHFLKEIYQQSTGKILEDIEQMQVEQLKKTLSHCQKSIFRTPGFKYLLSRDEFEQICQPFIQQCLDLIDIVLSDAKMEHHQIDQIVLVGGTTRIPAIQSSLKQIFGPDIPINKSINPDEAVAYGAAIQASILLNVGSKTQDLLLLDVTPLSMGIETSGGLMNRIIERQSSLPIESSKVFSTVDDNQSSVKIKVYQGERQFTKDNICLGTFVLDGLPRAPRGVPKIKVTFKLDCNGLLEVEAYDKNTGLSSNITFNADSNLTQDQIGKLVEEAERLRAHDQNQKRLLEEVNRYQQFIHQIQKMINQEDMRELLGDDLSPLNQYLMNVLDWIIVNRESDLETIKVSRDDVEFHLKPYLDKMYSYQEKTKNDEGDVDVMMDEKQITSMLEDMLA